MSDSESGMRRVFGTAAISIGLSALWDELVGLIFSEILDMKSWGIAVPEWLQNISGLLLIAVGIAAFNWHRITAWRKKLPYEDARTSAGRKVYVSRSIDLTGVANHEITETVFVDCDLYGDTNLYLEASVYFGDSFHLKPNNRFNNVVYLVDDGTVMSNSVTFRNCTLLKCRINTTNITVSRTWLESNDPNETLRTERPPQDLIADESRPQRNAIVEALLAGPNPRKV